MHSNSNIKFYLSSLLIYLFLALIVSAFSSGWKLIVVPLIPALINVAVYYFLFSGWFLRNQQFNTRFYILKALGLILNIIMFLVVFLAGMENLKLGIFVYLVSYLFFLFHFTYFVTKGLKKQ